MPQTDNNFEEVLRLFEENGWKLYRIQGRNRIFTKDGERHPCVIPVENKKVKAEYVEEIKQFLREKKSENRRSK
jgi:predicted RNA binding protein YcfA (HicA-like mRNA interferase family)